MAKRKQAADRQVNEPRNRNEHLNEESATAVAILDPAEVEPDLIEPVETTIIAPVTASPTTRENTRRIAMRHKIIKRLIANAEKIYKACLEDGGSPELLEQSYRLARFCVVTQQLFNAFRSPRNVDGDDGVANELNISRNAVYVRVKAIGCDLERLRDKKTHIDDLLLSNWILRTIVSDIQSENDKSLKLKLTWPNLSIDEERDIPAIGQPWAHGRRM
jgi:hypothetical protein